jgi:hypothetical protein
MIRAIRPLLDSSCRVFTVVTTAKASICGVYKSVTTS